MSGPLTFQQEAGAIYQECKRNHAATLGCSTVDGCQEFLPAGIEGTREAMVCDACACHRNFHRKVVLVNGTVPLSPNSANAAAASSPPPPIGSPIRMINEGRNNNGADAKTAPPSGRKMRSRIRTIFTAEQKAQLVSFARRLEWKIKNASEDEVDSFCNNLGITRKVFRGWLNNNRQLYTAGTA